MSTRTVQQAPERHHTVDKWACVFQTYIYANGTQHLASTAKTSAIWETQEAAHEAGHRALVILEDTGKFPNMCEKW